MLKLMRAPAKYVQGEDALLELRQNVENLGKSFLFICSGSGRKATEDKIRQSFASSEAQIYFETFGGISSRGEIEKMGRLVQEKGIDVVCGVGGGSAIDTAKATAYYQHKPVVIVPTVCATDAPCTGLSVIYQDDGTFDSYLFYPQNPDVVVVDTSIIAKAPVRFLVSGMGDALGTFFEARVCERNHAPSLENGGVTRSAMALCRLCWDTLQDKGLLAKVDAQQGLLTPAVEAIVEANTYLSGVGADNGGLAVAHSVYNGFTALEELTAMHGEVVAYGTLAQLLLEDGPTEEFWQVHRFCRSVGLPVTLAEMGITDKSRVIIAAEKACAPGESIHNMAWEISPKNLEQALLSVDALSAQQK